MENNKKNLSKNENKKGVLEITSLVFSILSVIAIFIFIIIEWKVWRSNFSSNETGDVPSESGFDLNKTLGNLANLQEKYSFPAFEYKKSEYQPNIPDYDLKLSDLDNIKDFSNNSQGKLKPIKFSDSQKQVLEDNNFVIVENNDNFFNDDPQQETSRVDDWTDIYDAIGGPWSPQSRHPDNSVFITSDFVLHLYHRLLDKEFKYIEQTEFYPRLKKITDAMFDVSLEAYNDSSNKAEKESYQRLITYFAVPKVILDSSYYFYTNKSIVNNDSDSKEAVLKNLEALKNSMPSKAYDLARQEVKLVMAASESKSSPLFGPYMDEVELSFSEDYTQYGPRSHYGENPVLRNYWRSMMWYGRQNFIAKSSELTRDAVNIVLLSEHSEIMNDWEDIYIPTSFFVGESDDLGIYDYRKILTEEDAIIDDEVISKLQDKIKKLEGPKIMSSMVVGNQVSEMSKEELQDETRGFHFMGQRFTPDAFIFSSLTQGDEKPDPETGESLPSMPTALMVMSSLGNETSRNYLDKWIETDAPGSVNVINNRINSLEKYFADLSLDSWTQNIYWSWLYTLKSLSQENLDKSGYPNFMKNEDWNNKNLQSAFGSWTELKHDTLLYAKQSYAEMGGGGPEGDVLPVPKGYVEPNIEFWDRIIPLAKMTREGLEQRDLLSQQFQGRNDKLVDALEFFRKIAIAELNNEIISEDDFEKLRLIAGNLENVISPLPSEQGIEDLARSALIADVHTDVPDGQILYEADGIPNYIFVAVKDVNGARLTKGLVYSYYEFTNPLEKRLTDTDWKNWIYERDSNKIPKQPFWNKLLTK